MPSTLLVLSPWLVGFAAEGIAVLCGLGNSWWSLAIVAPAVVVTYLYALYVSS